MLFWVGFSVPFKKETSVLALRRSHVYSAGIKLFLKSARQGEPQLYLYQKGDDAAWQRRLTLWLQRNIKAGSRGWGRGRKTPARQGAALREGKNLFQLWKGSEAVSGAAVWVASLILMTLQPSYVGEAPPTLSKLWPFLF